HGPPSRRLWRKADGIARLEVQRDARGHCRPPSPPGQKKKTPPKRALWEKSRQRPTLPHGFPCSTIGSEELNFRVRDGIGCGLLEITTGNCGSCFVQSAHVFNQKVL